MENKKCSKPPTRLGLLFPTEWTRWILQHKKCWINGGIIINFRLASSKKTVYHAKMKDICYKL